MEGDRTADGPGGNAEMALASEGHYRHRRGPTLCSLGAGAIGGRENGNGKNNDNKHRWAIPVFLFS